MFTFFSSLDPLPGLESLCILMSCVSSRPLYYLISFILLPNLVRHFEAQGCPAPKENSLLQALSRTDSQQGRKKNPPKNFWQRGLLLGNCLGRWWEGDFLLIFLIIVHCNIPSHPSWARKVLQPEIPGETFRKLKTSAGPGVPLTLMSEFWGYCASDASPFCHHWGPIIC